MYSAFIEKGQKRAESLSLPAIFVKQATFAQLKLALSWMSNVLQGVREGEERHTHSRLFSDGTDMIKCAILNLDSDQIFEIRETLSSLVNQSSHISDQFKELS